MLAEYVVSSEDGLVEIPEHLSYEEAATLPCAALTAWVSLFKHARPQPNDYVLLQGTGGVSSFGLLFIRPIIDRVFEFDEAPAAFDFMLSGDYMGKIVIRH